MKKLMLLCVLGTAGISFAASQYFGVPLTPLAGGSWRVYCMEVGTTSIVLSGLDGTEFTTRTMGRNTALTSQIDRGAIRVAFDPAVKAVNMTLSSDPGYESEPPIVTCYGRLNVDGLTDPVAYQFGPGMFYATYPSTSQFSSGTPSNDEFLFTHCEWTGTAWRIAFAP